MIQIEGWVAGAGGFFIALLFGVLGYLAKGRVERVETDLERERTARAAEFTKEREAREKDRHDLRDAINGVGVRLADLREKVLSECINHEGMRAAMEPVMTRLGEIRSDIKEIYGRLERKVDKE